jgi:hypothetical protein|tara:strand:- start:1773 stop:2735 length:963 start_codon:yes stop_codon:yes gene_type:complete
MNNRKIELATATNITTTYAGEFAGEYIAAALLSASTIDDGGLTVKPNIAYKEVIKRLDTGAVVSDASCDFNPNSSVTLTERIIEPTELQVNLQLCKKDFINDWEAQSMGYGMGRTLPPKFSDFMLAHVANQVAQKTEQTIFTGVAANAGEYDGFETLMTADGNIPAGQDLAAVGGGINSGNVIAELSRVVDAIPSALYGKEDLFIYIPSATAKAYVQALGGFAANGLGAAGVNDQGTQWWNNGSLTVNGVKIFVCPGMSANKMFAAQRSNLYFGCGLLNNMNEVKVIDMQDIDGSQNVRMIMRFSASVQYGISEDLVYYS